MPSFLIFAFVFFFGLVIGSFLNCVIYRLDKEENLVSQRSHCPFCGHTLSWQDLIPFLSFLLLKGKCRYCKKPISWQYPLVELATAILFVFLFQWHSRNFSLAIGSPFAYFFSLAYLFFAASFLIVIFVYDLKYYLVADEVIYPAIVLSFLADVFFAFSGSHFPQRDLIQGSFYNLFTSKALAAVLAAGFFLIIVLISQEKWMGMGDVKLAIFMGLFLGWPQILVALFAAFFFGAIIGIGLIVFSKKKLKSEVPFAPFLISATFIALFWGEKIISWYLSLFFNF